MICSHVMPSFGVTSPLAGPQPKRARKRNGRAHLVIIIIRPTSLSPFARSSANTSPSSSPSSTTIPTMRKQDVLSFLASFFCLLSTTYAQVTIYNDPGQSALGTGTQTSSAAQESYTGLGAYDPLVLTPPPIPDPAPPREFGITLLPFGQPGLSIPLQGNVLGFSIEMSVLDQVCEWIFGCYATLLVP